MSSKYEGWGDVSRWEVGGDHTSYSLIHADKYAAHHRTRPRSSSRPCLLAGIIIQSGPSMVIPLSFKD